MTQRTEGNPPTPIETATEKVLNALSATITKEHKAHGLEHNQRTSEKDFRRILALYFHDKTLQDWCRDLGIQDATDPAHKPSHGGDR